MTQNCQTCGSTKPLTEFRKFTNGHHRPVCETCLGRDLRGQRFGSLVVTDRGSRGNKSESRWQCKCDCGNAHLVREFSLRQGHVKSCGCKQGRDPAVRLPDGKVGLNKLWGSYRKIARKRDLVFELTAAEFEDLTCLDCYYCGLAPSSISRQGKPHTAYRYNGIDRVDNTVGYVMSNVVPCCKTCNLAKRTMTLEEFYSWVSRLYANKPWSRQPHLKVV